MKTEIIDATLKISPAFEKEQTSRENHRLEWELTVKAYLIPDRDCNGFYPRHRTDVQLSVRPRETEPPSNMRLVRINAFDDTVTSGGSQLIVREPGLVGLTFDGETTPNTFSYSLADVEEQTEFSSRFSTPFRCTLNPARENSNSIKFEGELQPKGISPSEDQLLKWSLDVEQDQG